MERRAEKLKERLQAQEDRELIERVSNHPLQEPMSPAFSYTRPHYANVEKAKRDLRYIEKARYLINDKEFGIARFAYLSCISCAMSFMTYTFYILWAKERAEENENTRLLVQQECEMRTEGGRSR